MVLNLRGSDRLEKCIGINLLVYEVYKFFYLLFLNNVKFIVVLL